MFDVYLLFPITFLIAFTPLEVIFLPVFVNRVRVRVTLPIAVREDCLRGFMSLSLPKSPRRILVAFTFSEPTERCNSFIITLGSTDFSNVYTSAAT